jgi:hypothetical protein
VNFLNKLVLLMAVATLAMPAAFAKKKPRLIYDHTATMVYHAAKVRNLIEGRTDLYHAGEYTCTPGDEHYAPDCRTYTDWFVTEAVSYTEITLDDGTEIVVTDSPSLCWCDHHSCEPEETKTLDGDCRKREPWDHDKIRLVVRRDVENIGNPLLKIASDWTRSKEDIRGKLEFLKDGAKETFRYSLLQGGEIEIDPVDLLRAAS